MACEEFYIDIDGRRVHAKLDRPEDTERGPLAIVFHGFTGHMEERHIVAVAEGLRAEGVSTLRVDLYGHGKSDGAFADHTLYKWVTQGLAVIDYARGLDFVDALYVAHEAVVNVAYGPFAREYHPAVGPCQPYCVYAAGLQARHDVLVH